MALTKYIEKRNFKVSPEPTGGSPDSEQLRFVIQKQLTEEFSIEEYKDSYTAKLLKRIKEKSKGKKITPPKMKVVHKQSDNLMDMLKASLEGSKKSKTA